MGKIIFITGTDTGVGKTLLTALLLQHLREQGCHALAMKPFCSGGRDDVNLLQSLQPGELTDEEMNPFYFKQPLAPLIAARQERREEIKLREAVQKIRAVQRKCDCLLVEGAGGVLVPLGRNFTITGVIRALKCEVIVVSRNRLGTINHTCLTIKALQAVQVKHLTVVLMSEREQDYSFKTNGEAIMELLKHVLIVPMPFLGNGASKVEMIKKNSRKVKKSLAMLPKIGKLSAVLLKNSK